MAQVEKQMLSALPGAAWGGCRHWGLVAARFGHELAVVPRHRMMDDDGEQKEKRMKRLILGMCLLALVAGYSYAQFDSSGKKQKNQLQLRELTGRVVDHSAAPLENAIVYLKSSKTLVVKTYITATDGKYRFPALAPNVDYGIYAECKGKKSDVKTLSSFDSRAQPYITLRINMVK
jgi:hypothetical protein